MYCLLARPCIFQPGNFTGWGSEGVNPTVLFAGLHCPLREIRVALPSGTYSYHVSSIFVCPKNAMAASVRDF